MTTVAIRGATSILTDTQEELDSAIPELITAMLESNGLTPDEVISILFTGTPDITSKFPATSLRGMGFADTPLICAQEMDVVGAHSLIVRVLMHVEMQGPIKELKGQIKHQYLRNASALRPDISSTPNGSNS